MLNLVPDHFSVEDTGQVALIFLSPGPSTVSGTQKALKNILLIYADVYVYICACAFTVYEYVHINTRVYILMFLHVNRCVHMYSSMDTCIVLGT